MAFSLGEGRDEAVGFAGLSNFIFLPACFFT
jgi:hypothetical protein